VSATIEYPIGIGNYTDPYPRYAELRHSTPILWHEPTQTWYFFRHADVKGVLKSHSIGTIPFQPRDNDVMPFFSRLLNRQMLRSDPPAHTRLRTVVAPWFLREKLNEFRPLVREITAALLDDGVSDFVPDVATRVPPTVLARALRISPEDITRLQPASVAMVGYWEWHHESDTAAVAERGAAEIDEYFRALVQLRRRLPGEDIVTDLIAAGLTDDEALVMIVLLVNAGHETTVNQLGNSVLALLSQRRAWEELVSDPSIAPLATEELLRFDTSVQTFPRRVLNDLEIGGFELKENATVEVVFGSANRDETVFDRPDDLFLRRQPNPQLSFGVGIHTCLGAPLARLEIAEVLSTLVTKRPDLGLAAEPVWRPQLGIRGLASLPVR
jgi:cytochrome P450